MGKFDLSQYEEVRVRLPKFFEKYPEGRVITDIIAQFNDLETIVVKATLFEDGDPQKLPLATGIAYEKNGDGYINKTSHVENAETSAVGRALANLGLHGSKRPSREEMEKVERMTKEQAVDNVKDAFPGAKVIKDDDDLL